MTREKNKICSEIGFRKDGSAYREMIFGVVFSYGNHRQGAANPFWRRHKNLDVSVQKRYRARHKKLLEFTHNPQPNVLKVNVINSQEVGLSLLCHSGLDPEASKIKRFSNPSFAGVMK